MEKTESIKCIGCGSTLQTQDEAKLGYVKPSALEKQAEDLLCKRCFRLKHYNELPDITMTNDEFVHVLSKIAHEDALIVKVVDLFDFSGSMISGLNRFIGNNDILLVGNKRDLLPKAIKPLKITNWMRRLIKEYGLQVEDAVLTSAEKGHGIDELISAIEEYRRGRNVYIVGCTNVGKSTLVNAIIKRYTEERNDVITVSKFPGTTIDFIEIPIDETSLLIDTPGIVNEHQIAHFLNKESLKHIYPKKEVKPRVYQLNDQQSLFFDGLARVDYVKGEKTSFTCFFNNETNIHRTKLEKADDLFKRHVGTLFVPPTEEEYTKMGEYRKQNFRIPDYKCDLVISGLGFITIDSPRSSVVIHAPEHVGVFIRPSLL